MPLNEQDQKIWSQASFLSGLFEGENEVQLNQLPYDYSFPAPSESFDPEMFAQWSANESQSKDSLSSVIFSKGMPVLSLDKEEQPLSSIILTQEQLTTSNESLNDSKLSKGKEKKEKDYNLRPNRSKKRVPLAIIELSKSEEELNSFEEAPIKKKRAYYRKTEHPKEFLERVEKERLIKKRSRNRELAAKSRKKRKERMEFLEREHLRLTTENKRLLKDNENLRQKFLN